MFNKLRNLSQKVAAIQQTLTVEMMRPFLFTFGVTLLVLSTSSDAFAGQIGATQKMYDVIGLVLAFIEGPFGALIMVTAGLGAIVAAAMGSYKAALGLFVVGVGAFVLRALVGIFFGNTINRVNSTNVVL